MLLKGELTVVDEYDNKIILLIPSDLSLYYDENIFNMYFMEYDIDHDVPNIAGKFYCGRQMELEIKNKNGSPYVDVDVMRDYRRY